jgi:DNA-binding GntR family transcriptional regulator
MPRPRLPRVDFEVAAPILERHELWVGVADALREAIVSGAIGAGANLVEADLADRFAVSRGPVRDALRELAREGLVVDVSRRGTVVSTLTLTDLQEVYSVREALEVAAAQWAIERAPDRAIAALEAHITAMESAWARMADYADSLAEDLAFHRELVAISANGRIIPFYEQMLSQTQLLARSAALGNPTLGLGMDPSAHRDIYGAMVDRDLGRARLAIASHYVYAQERLFFGGSLPI